MQSVDRAISVLEILAQRGEAGVSEVAAEIDVHKSTAFRLLGALEARGLVEQAGERGKYRLGFGIVRLAGAVTGRIDITQQGRPVCERLAEEIGETVNIAVLQEHYAINLYQVRGPGAVTAHNWVGQLTPLHATSSGKCLLAYLPAKERAALLAEAGLKKVTPHTITSKAKLEKTLAEVREAGAAGIPLRKVIQNLAGKSATSADIYALITKMIQAGTIREVETPTEGAKRKTHKLYLPEHNPNRKKKET